MQRQTGRERASVYLKLNNSRVETLEVPSFKGKKKNRKKPSSKMGLSQKKKKKNSKIIEEK